MKNEVQQRDDGAKEPQVPKVGRRFHLAARVDGGVVIRIDQIADEMTKSLSFPVSRSAILRMLINRGIADYGREAQS